MPLLSQRKLLKKNYQLDKLKILLKFLKKSKSIKSSKDPNIINLEQDISNKTGLSVIIKNNRKNKGTITFSYHDIEQLNKIIDIIKSNY